VKPILIAILLAFAAYTLYAMSEVGLSGIYLAGFANAGSLQVLLDLVIVCFLISCWMVIDARANGRNPWLYVLITLAAGSFGPLLYLLLAPERATAAPREAVQRA
jgi:Terpene cyclase DEP1